ncbi:hypothetical protein QTU67_003673 [Vibrio cholerae]|uniref:hypothetical protein n=2 Tax=Vibrio cholerae TaxID=666 RepID=UPI0011D34E66|nr:hypothetical protein [Vibrio cholerae]EGQ7881862.1 hypothetical protein [Vibrio cholerae]EGQ8476419.1 hypothetical protein [Vibrio cholerae]EGQ9437396.1 hypothetical protein [Vibrio cholerae]EGQ9635566.1 hypothetical protein [Vibrio cholerae]EGR0031564.1 hypothetical protein [Vibrio cholerae]
MEKIKNWQIQIGGWGFILWFATFKLSDFLKEKGFELFSHAISGYMIGFVTAFSAVLFWDIIHGRWKTIFGDDGFWGRVSVAIPLFVLTFVGFMGFYGTIVGSAPWQYNLGFAIAGIVFQQGTYPLIRMLDGKP